MRGQARGKHFGQRPEHVARRRPFVRVGNIERDAELCFDIFDGCDLVAVAAQADADRVLGHGFWIERFAGNEKGGPLPDRPFTSKPFACRTRSLPSQG